MAFMPHARREGATKHPVDFGLVLECAETLALPACFECRGQRLTDMLDGCATPKKERSGDYYSNISDG
jgi:hypothetical protein